MLHRILVASLAIALAPAPPAVAQTAQTIAGYAEWHKADALIVDGQRIIVGQGTAVSGAARDLASITLGAEVKARGVRQPDGSLLARSIEVKGNRTSFWERELADEADALERQWLRQREVSDAEDPDAGGRLLRSGPQVERVRRIFGRLVPPYLADENFRVYVVDNDDWNAFAMPNGSIWVFTGLLRAMDDDELAVVLGHELAHVTHEHARRGSKKSIWTNLLAAAVGLAAEQIENDALRTVAEVATLGTALAVDSAFGRDAEDQADRVGLRYVFEAGFDVRKGPVVWQRFEEEYGAGNRIVNFFLSGHSRAPVRRAHMEQQIAWNYTQGPEVSTMAVTAAAPRRRTQLEGPAAAEVDKRRIKQAVLHAGKSDVRRR